MSLDEAEILTRVISPDDPSLESKVAEAIMRMGFKEPDKGRIDELAELARQGTLSCEGQAEAESYELHWPFCFSAQIQS